MQEVTLVGPTHRALRPTPSQQNQISRFRSDWLRNTAFTKIIVYVRRILGVGWVRAFTYS